MSLVGRHCDVLKRLGDGEPSTLLEAEAVIEEIREEKGYLDSETIQHVNSIPNQSRDKVWRRIEKSKENEAAYTKSISEQLYSSKYQFLYELVQNADDSLYRITKDNATLSFTITPQKFMIETNEDGFTRKNVVAICATGKSSKKATAADDHIGEKGFGFKSVFSVADEVRIQSGVWSFRFEHRRGDDGLGMVTPLDAPLKRLQEGMKTKITLRLAKRARKDYQKLVEAVVDMPETTIFFLRKLEVIRIDITHQDEQRETMRIVKTEDEAKKQVTITRFQGLKKDASVYHKVTFDVTGMPADERRKGQQSVKVDLAFPIDPITRQPKLSELGQYVFAYLPLRRLPNVQFLINSDFITSASREGIIDCAWNDEICKAVAQTFANSVQRFAVAGHPLLYSWLDFLPTAPMEHPWTQLYASIKTKLESMYVFQTWEGRHLKRRLDVRRLSAVHLFEHEPILRDLESDLYIAPEYTARHDKTLGSLGVSPLTCEDVILRLQADLIRPDSRVKTKESKDPWHTAFATLGLHLLRHSNATLQQKFKQLAFIPLSKPNQWTGAPNMGRGGLDNIYFPYTGTTEIPDDIGLHLLDREASKNSTRKKFYEALGVTECPKETVLAKIETSQRLGGRFNLSRHLTYLFHYHAQPEQLSPWLKVPIDTNQYVSAQEILYFPSDNDYDMDQLLPQDMRADLSLDIKVLPWYLVDLNQSRSSVSGESWQDWLEKITKAQYHPSDLSQHLKLVLQHNPWKFLGTLRAHQKEYAHLVQRTEDSLRGYAVLCLSRELLPMATTYLPTVEVLEALRNVGIDDDADEFAILDLPDGDLTDVTYREWRFLEDFGARSKPDLNFYESALLNLSSGDQVSLEQVTKLYRSMALLVTVADQEDLRSFFHNEVIWNSVQWVCSDECVWKGPDFLHHTSVLETYYPRDSHLESFFTKSLDIGNCTLSTVMQELKDLKTYDEDSIQLSSTREIYEYLNANIHDDNDWKEIRKDFNDNLLVLGENQVWYSLDTCLWKSPFPLTSYQDVSIIYPSLEDFFVKRMGIKQVSPTMLISEIEQMAQQDEPRIETIRLRLIETGMILAKSDVNSTIESALNTLKEVKFLPKRLADGASVLVGVKDDFFIVDHARYGRALASHGIALDFNVDETQMLDVMFQHLGITDRYLSVAVVEESSVGDEVVLDEELSLQLQKKAYALYCCAAKHKSRNALRNERELFDQLCQASIFRTSTLTTHLVLQLKEGPLKLQNDRSFPHHDMIDDYLNIYIPEDVEQRRICYRTHLPDLLVRITGINRAALHDIAIILASDLRDLNDILVEQDISDVSWIEKPVIHQSDLQDGEQRTPGTPANADRHVNPNEDTASHMTAGLSQSTPRGASIALVTPAPAQYRDLIDQVIRSARILNQDDRADIPGRCFDPTSTFGIRQQSEFTYNRRIGAVGEAFVFELLTALNLPDFTRAQWQSTIRGTLAIHPHYADLQNWTGREIADIVYTDRTGSLTQYLRDHGEGHSSAFAIPVNHNHAEHPIEYFLEVKTTPGPCNSRFFMSDVQCKRMERMSLGIFLSTSQLPKKVYVILRVFDIVKPNVGLKIFVDPWRLRGTNLLVNAEQWIGTTM
ncbi:hypothetical protein K504DRAFT_507325 [Pleomassaria siparia CBS 279.74]|uniref:Protein NO VEIN C-terminal domain-containing protein n=1 Tax=Pleomassaria siparia CBS 279.74 TaxID=1314801 RepID=A0A6G1JVX3_9PLEO|nr:hypothetical protein K504DRAFT_507325 [Pleomassaria siparia CBS 279.74]